MTKQIRIFLADDDAVFRESLRALLPKLRTALPSTNSLSEAKSLHELMGLAVTKGENCIEAIVVEWIIGRAIRFSQGLAVISSQYVLAGPPVIVDPTSNRLFDAVFFKVIRTLDATPFVHFDD